jgi:hypothetical protein
MCFVFIWEHTATCATYSINWLVFITEMKSVYCAVRTGSLNKSVGASSLKSYCNLHGQRNRTLVFWHITARTNEVLRWRKCYYASILFLLNTDRVRRLAAGLFPRRIIFKCRPVRVEFLTDEVAMVQNFLQIFQFFSVSFSFQNLPVYTHYQSSNLDNSRI